MKKRLLVPLAFLPVLLLLVAAAATAEEKLPSDPAILTGKLENGVTWFYRQHDNPPGRMALMVNVDTGSFNETEEERGLAHFLEHMVFNGSENFAPGELIPYFESIGLTFGADANAYTSFDQTVYMIYLPDTETAQVDKALLVLSDLVFRALLLEEEIDKERNVIIEEKRARKNAQMRLREKLWPRLFEDSRLAERIPIGTEEVILDAPRSRFEKFYRTWYRPDRMTVLIVGDAEPERVLPLVEKQFGSAKALMPPGDEHGPEFRFFDRQRALVITDPEVTSCDVQMVTIRPTRGPVTTVEGMKSLITESLACAIVNRRLEERIQKGEAAFHEGTTGVHFFFGGALVIEASVRGEPDRWVSMLEEMVMEVSRAREHGLMQQELDLVKAEFMASTERMVRTEPTRNARSFLMEMNKAVNEGEPVLSAEQSLALVKRLLPEIEIDDVSAVFSTQFEPGTFTYIVTLPEKEGVSIPGSDDVLAAARASLARKTESLEKKEGAREILTERPEPGRVLEKEKDEDLGITSAWLENGVRVHHRFMDYKKDTVLLGISLAGGGIEETVKNIGITQAAILAFKRPATSRLTSTEIADLMVGKNIGLQADLEMDALAVTLMGSPEDLEPGLELVHALLVDGKIEKPTFDIWKSNYRQQIEAMQSIPDFHAASAMQSLVSGHDPRLVPLTVEQLDSLALPPAQKWLDRLFREAPIEVAVVGDISLEKAMPLVARYIGSLPVRKRIATYLDPLRRLDREPGPLEDRVSVNTITPKSTVLYGFLACGHGDVKKRRLLKLAQQTLSSRLTTRIREELALAYTIGAQYQILWAFDDTSLFLTGTPCDPGKSDEVVREVAAVYAKFAEDGPAAEELEKAKLQMINQIDQMKKEPQYWFSIMQHLDFHELDLDDYKNIEATYEAFTKEEVRNVFREYLEPERTISVIAEPVGAAREKVPAGGVKK